MLDAINQIPPKRDSQFAACFFQTSKRVATSFTNIVSRGTTYFSFFYIFPDVPFAQIVMQRDVRPVENKKQLRFVFMNSF